MKNIWLERKTFYCLIHIKLQNTIINENYLAVFEIMHILRKYMMTLNYSLETYIANEKWIKLPGGIFIVRHMYHNNDIIYLNAIVVEQNRVYVHRMLNAGIQ